MFEFLKQTFGWNGKGAADKVTIPPGETVTLGFNVPAGCAPLKLGVEFLCGKCARKVTQELPVTGGTVQGVCECGTEYHLEVGPAERSE